MKNAALIITCYMNLNEHEAFRRGLEQFNTQRFFEPHQRRLDHGNSPQEIFTFYEALTTVGVSASRARPTVSARRLIRMTLDRKRNGAGS